MMTFDKLPRCYQTCGSNDLRRGNMKHCNRNIIRINRCANVDSSPTLIPTGTVVVTFKGKHFLMYISIFYIEEKFSTYMYPVILCFRCLRFGHTQRLCGG